MSIYSTLNAAKRSNGAKKKHEEQKIMMKIHLATENYGQKNCTMASVTHTMLAIWAKKEQSLGNSKHRWSWECNIFQV